MKYLKNCKKCDKEFETKNKDKEFCSHNHKHAYLKRQQNLIQYTCECCGTSFESTHKNRRACSKKCIAELGRNKTREIKRLENEEKYKDVKDIPTCVLCGWKSGALHSHIAQFHKITVEEYKQTYEVSDSEIYHSTYLEDLSERVKGDKNPAYQHGGKFSPYSKKFIKYEGLSDDQKNSKIDVVVQQAKETSTENYSYNTTVEYYEKQGMSREEAVKARSKRQATFSLAICIEKFGEEKGKQIWEERQDKWMETLDAFSDEEKLRILKLKINALDSTYSMISQELFNTLNISDSYYGENEKLLKTKDAAFSVDFLYENKIIEFYGDFWHANPIKYEADSILNFPSRISNNRRVASKIWNRDAFRIKELNNAGYETLIIWEYDYKNNKDETVKRCLEFLES